MGLSEAEKARRYEMRAPGVDIPIEQKAERYERYDVKERMAGLPRRRGRLPQSSAMGFHSPSAWCKCGRLNGHEGDCS